jgi:DNA-directed RNA polymerase subunit M/transcription elongation factor TFIIS
MTVIFQLLFAVPEFMASGGRVMQRLKKMLKACQLPSDGPFSRALAKAALLEFHLTEVRTMLSLGKVRLFPLGEQGDPLLFLGALLTQEGMNADFCQLFRNDIKTDTGCSTCGYATKNYARKEFLISLDVGVVEEPLLLQDIVRVHLEKQDFEHDTVLCPNCDRNVVSMWRQQTIVNPAKVLVLELKRARKAV